MANKVVAGTFSGNGSSSSVPIQKGGVIKLGSSGASNFGSGTVTVQAMGKDALWYGSADTFTAADVVNVEFSEPTLIRLTLSGSTSPSLAYEIQSDSPTIIE